MNLVKPITTPSSSQSGGASKGGTTSGLTVALEKDEEVISDPETEGAESEREEGTALAKRKDRISLPSVRPRPTSSYAVSQPAAAKTAAAPRPQTAAARGRTASEAVPQPQNRKELDESIRKLHRKMIRKERKVEQVCNSASKPSILTSCAFLPCRCRACGCWKSLGMKAC